MTTEAAETITFRCGCGRRLRVGAELAGGGVQCPACGRLTSVPDPDDRFDDDGGMALADEPPPNPRAVGSVGTLAYANPATRTATPVSAATHERHLAQAGPIRRRAATAFVDDAPGRPLWKLPADLLLPANAIVAAMALGVMALFVGFAAMSAAGAYPLALVALAVGLILTAHYVNVIDETGPEGRDELPPPLRDLDFWEDVFRPNGQLLAATLICLLPSACLLWTAGPTPGAMAFAAGFALLGMLAFPAVLLTLVAGGTVLNLLPHRLAGVVAISGGAYWVAALLLLPLTLALHAACCLFVAEVLAQLYDASILGTYTAGPGGVGTPSTWWWAGPAAVLAGMGAVYVTHALGWTLGRLYRRHVDRFPWLLMRHVRTAPATAS